MTAARSVCSVSILALLAFGFSLPAQAAANRINGVRVSKTGESTVVEIDGERAPNFTTFKQDSPRRVIVDVAECHLGAVPDRIQGDGKLVSAVTTAQYGQAPHGISRVIIGLSSAAEYKVTTRGGSLFVHLTPGAGGLLVSAGVPVAPPRPSHGAAAGSSADLDLPLDVSPPLIADAENAPAPAAEPRPAPVEEPPAEPESLAAAEAAPQPEPEPAAEPAPIEPAAQPVKVAMASPPPATAAAPAPSEAAEPEPSEAAEPAPAPTRVAQDDSEVEEVDDDVPVADEVGEEEVEPPPPPPPAEEEEVAPPPPPADEGAVEDVPAPAEEVEDVPPPPPADEGAFEDVPPPAEEVEDVPPPPPADTSVEDVPVAPGASDGGDRIEVGGALKDMTWVGFQQTMESSRVFIKTTEPVRFHVTEEGDNLVVLELENTRIPLRNNTRFLDTHFFDSAVTMITPREIEGASRNVRIEIQLRNKVPFSSGQDENMVYLDFQRQ